MRRIDQLDYAITDYGNQGTDRSLTGRKTPSRAAGLRRSGHQGRYANIPSTWWLAPWHRALPLLRYPGGNDVGNGFHGGRCHPTLLKTVDLRR